MECNKILFDFRNMPPPPPRTKLTSGMAAYCGLQHMRTPSQKRLVLHMRLAREYNCAPELVDEEIRGCVRLSWYHREPSSWKNFKGEYGATALGYDGAGTSQAGPSRVAKFRPAGSTRQGGMAWNGGVQRQRQQNTRRGREREVRQPAKAPQASETMIPVPAG